MARSSSRAPSSPADKPVPAREAGRRGEGSMLPARGPRRAIESGFVRLVATAGIVGIDVGVAAILASSKVEGWIIGLSIGLVSVILSAILWSSRHL